MKRIYLFTIVLMFQQGLSAQHIFRTACQGNIARLDSLLAYTPIDTSDERDRTLLHWAIACDEQAVLDFLLERGIPLNAQDDQGKTPMHMAIRFDRATYFDQLLEQQKDAAWIDSYGASLLEAAVLLRHQPFIQKLIDSGVPINSTNERGSTALEIAQRLKEIDLVAFLQSLGADPQLVRSLEPRGTYMGQQPPGNTPVVFAPNFISTEEYEFGSIFNAAGTEFYYGVDVGGNSEIRFSKLVEGAWAKPEVLLSHSEYGYNDPFLSPDENRLYFISRMPPEGVGPQKPDHDIWYIERTGSGWSDPINAGPNINSDGNEYYISFTQNGTMYFSSNVNAPTDRKRSDLDIYYSAFVDGGFQPPIAVGSAINTAAYEADVYVDPAETYLIFCSTRSGGLGRGDLYISFKQPDGTWTKARNMGAVINSRQHELCPFVTIDGQYFFYTSDEDIYWVSANVIKQLREESR